MNDDLVNDSPALVGVKDPLPDGVLFMYRVNTTTNNVVDSVIIGEDGTFSFPNVPSNSTQRLLLTNDFIGMGQSAPASGTLPEFWFFTGEKNQNIIIPPNGNDGSVDGLLEVVVGTSNIANLEFGIQVEQLLLKYVFYHPSFPPLDNHGVIASQYTLGVKLNTTIETNFGVGTPGIAQVLITYCRMNVILQEQINVDKTSPTTFWNDIRNWMYANNFTDIELDTEYGFYYITGDYANQTYIALQNV